MDYKILITNAETGTMRFATAKKEIMEKEITQNEAGEDIIVEVPTGKFVTDVFVSSDKDEVKNKYVELLDQYQKKYLNVICDCNEVVTIDVEIECCEDTVTDVDTETKEEVDEDEV